ncbi:peptidylprolyl isomerase fpr4 [Apophysomyces ossiformis]|uniref:FK506-binding protein n=1 Tax=Apophysomyces ossiformis TaxID=679940 RepID=A0A8H7ETA1_9FUNG|nr:peptidylprolyl isomerase fpr4 [Apophysomyces ossiformis]
MSIQGFWGLHVVPGKTYSQTVTAPFRIAMASLSDEISETKRSSLCVKVDDKSFVLCSLSPEKIEQQPLDVTFVEGEEVTFFVKGPKKYPCSTIHLTGNYTFDDEDSELDEDIDMMDLPNGIDRKRAAAYLDNEAEEDEEEEDEDDEEDEEEESDEEEDEEEEEEEVAVKNNKKRPAKTEEEQPAKKRKAEQQQEQQIKKQEEQKKQAELKKKQEEQKKKQEEQKKKQEEQKKQAELKKKQEEQKKQAELKKKQEEQKKQAEEKKSKVVKLPNGLIVEDVKVGNGPAAKSGQRIGMRYIGKLTNGKVFDKNVSGKPFSFILGRGEVIKGWDIGVAGMKAGGERKLTIPAPLAYGKRGAPPDIPGNATLVFEIKLVNMK